MKAILSVLDTAMEVTVENQEIVALEFTQEKPQIPSDPLLMQLQAQLTDYSRGALMAFDLPLSPQGTDFQKKVWAALLTIPYGETRSYGQIAQQIGSPKASRAVGGACHRNPIGLIIPCHRVVGGQGALTGYAGGLDLKRMLLAHEKKAD